MRRPTRLTVDLEDEVLREVDGLRRQRGAGFQETLSLVLRAGLAALTQAPGRAVRGSFRTEPADCGQPRLANLDKITEVLAFAEAEPVPRVPSKR